MKKAVAILLLTIMPAVMAGCAGKKTEGTDVNKPAEPQSQVTTKEDNTAAKSVEAATLKDVALKEKELLAQLDPLHKKVNDLFKNFERGAISRSQLNNELLAVKKDIDKLKQESDEFYKNHKLSDSDKKDPLYTEGLKNGSRLRSTMSTIITTTLEGKTVINLQQKDASGNPLREKIIYDDEKIKAYYAEQEKKYQDYLRKLNNALASF